LLARRHGLRGRNLRASHVAYGGCHFLIRYFRRVHPLNRSCPGIIARGPRQRVRRALDYAGNGENRGESGNKR
jgi:hypothetical protein